MKLMKSLLVASLAMFIGLNTTNAETAKNTKQHAVKKQQVAKKQQSKRKSRSAPMTNEQALDAFNKSIGIKLVARDLLTDKQNNQAISLTYEIENRGNQPIKSVSWVNIYAVNKTVFHQQAIPLQFEKAFASKAKMRLNLELAFSTLSKEAQAIFSDPNQRVSSVTIARQIVFANGKKIEVKN